MTRPGTSVEVVCSFVEGKGLGRDCDAPHEFGLFYILLYLLVHLAQRVGVGRVGGGRLQILADLGEQLCSGDQGAVLLKLH